MTGLDTNVLVRYLTRDDADQSRKADAIFADLMVKGARGYVSARSSP